MIGTIFSRLVAIPRESLIASMFGDAVVTNSFTIAENVLTIFLDLLLSGIASAVLVPVLSEYVGDDQRDRLGAVVGKLLTLVVVGGLFIYEQEHVQSPATVKVSDTQLVEDVGRVAMNPEPAPVAPLRALFEE